MTKTKNTTTVSFPDDDGVDIEFEVPFAWAICPCCEGNGRTDNPAFSDGISAEDWNHEWDEEEREVYLRGGYDVRCEECDGCGKIQEADLSYLSAEDRRSYEEHLEQVAYSARERDAERRAGC